VSVERDAFSVSSSRLLADAIFCPDKATDKTRTLSAAGTAALLDARTS